MPNAKIYPGWGDMWTPPDARTLKPKRSGRGWIIAAAIVISVFVAGLGAYAYVGYQLSNVGSIGPTLNPIPVPSRSCPYLRLVRDTALAAGSASGAAERISDPHFWDFYSGALATKLTAFDLSLRLAAAHTPAPIASNLLAVHVQVMFGLTHVRKARTGVAWSKTTFDAVTNGYLSLNDASNLTGNACGFTLAPDVSIFFNSA